MKKRKVWQDSSAQRWVEQYTDGTLYEVTKLQEMSDGSTFVDAKKIDAERLKDLELDRPSRKGWADRAK